MPFDAARLAADTEAFCRELRPHEELCYVEHRFNDQLVPLAKKYDLLGINVKPEFGGRGADNRSYFQALARIGREGTGVRTFFSGHLSIGAYPIQTWGGDALKKKYLPAAAKGEKVLAFGLTEPDAGSNPREMTTTYERQGDRFVLNGVKYLISNGGIADAVVVFGYPANVAAADPRRRISAFVVDTKSEGFLAETFSPNAKMGMPTSNTAMFSMENVSIPIENLLGTEGEGFRVAMGSLVSGRLSVAAGCLGVIEDCLAESLDYAKTRVQHGK
ncbi:MAG TPA: acyl-CoA dehydrogenase family protein, partial [Urbifossiella sp.]